MQEKTKKYAKNVNLFADIKKKQYLCTPNYRWTLVLSEVSEVP